MYLLKPIPSPKLDHLRIYVVYVSQKFQSNPYINNSWLRNSMHPSLPFTYEMDKDFGFSTALGLLVNMWGHSAVFGIISHGPHITDKVINMYVCTYLRVPYY